MKYIKIIFFGLLISFCYQNVQKQDHLNLKDKLVGKWKTEAFEGEKHEEWRLMEDSNMQQKGFYIVKRDTLCSAITRIQKVKDEVILFSRIKNSNPKIFKATNINERSIEFENKDYKNPFHVKYECLIRIIIEERLKVMKRIPWLFMNLVL